MKREIVIKNMGRDAKQHLIAKYMDLDNSDDPYSK
jgi:hypothetical protein